MENTNQPMNKIRSEEMSTETRFDKLDNLLKVHDYTYEMSDDHNCWVKGTDEVKVIEKLITELSKLNPELVGELILKYNQEYGSQFEVVL